MIKEKWADIQSYEGCYRVSSFGRIKSLERTFLNKHEKKTRTIPEKILNMTPNSNGYLRVFLSKEGKVKTHYVHRLVAQHFCCKKEEHTEVNHINGDKLNNAFDNLEWCTRNQNLKHAFDNGLCKWGEESNLRKLTEKEVWEIRDAIDRGDKVTTIAKKFGVYKRTIHHIKSGLSWKRLKERVM